MSVILFIFIGICLKFNLVEAKLNWPNVQGIPLENPLPTEEICNFSVKFTAKHLCDKVKFISIFYKNIN